MVGRSAPDSRRFDALVREHYARLRNFVIRYTESADEADDIVQDVFVRIWERAHEFDWDDPLPYLYQATRNAATSAARKQRVRAAHRDAASQEPPKAQPDVAEDLQAVELDAAISEAVAALPPRCKEIFTMHREQGLSYSEIAKVLGLSVHTVDNQMGRALKALRARLAPYLDTLVVLAMLSVHR